MDSMFVNLVRGNRLSLYLGLEMLGEHAYRFSKDYSYIEVPLLHAENSEGVVDKALRNQHLKVIPACKFKVQGSRLKVLVKTNPLLQEVATAPTMYMIEEESGSPIFYMTMRKDFDLSKLDWVVRVYLLQ